MQIRTIAAIISVLASVPLGVSATSQTSVSEALEAATHPLAIPGDSTWSSWGGTAEFSFNPDRLVQLGIRVESLRNATQVQKGAPGLREEIIRVEGMNSGSLDFAVTGKKLEGLRGGSLQYGGGFVLAFDGGKADLRGLRIRASANGLFGLEVVDSGGTVWMTMDHAHFNLGENETVFNIVNMNSRLSAHFAAALGHSELTGLDLGVVDTHSNIFQRQTETASGPSAQVPQTDCTNNWPGVGSPPYTADITMIYGNPNYLSQIDGISAKRCNISTTGNCTTTSTTGEVVIDQDSSLRNTGTAAVTWYTMFAHSGTQPAPYGTDQHPMLVWNLYRQNADGTIKQIGVSGVKHAFTTVNFNCTCAGGSVIYPTCEDTYSTGNNDTSRYLAPRKEVIARTAQWGRCGSVFDANCDGARDGGSSGGGATNLHEFRLNAIESDLLPPLSTGAHYYLEYFYVVRDDINIYNTMAFREILPTKSGSSWAVSLSPTANFTQGPIINQWVSPTSPPVGATNQELNSPEGHARVAVKTTDIGGGSFHYQYSVMNFDFARAVIDPAHPTEPNLKVLSNTGFNSFAVAVPATATITNLQFNDADLNAGNDWTATNADGVVSWQGPAGNELNWETMYTFSFDADSAPVTGDAALGVAEAGAPSRYTVTTLAPLADPVMVDGFDSP
ncbi:MAG: hypothetical protein ABI451_08435 [Dokdonella sp.]